MKRTRLVLKHRKKLTKLLFTGARLMFDNPPESNPSTCSVKSLLRISISSPPFSYLPFSVFPNPTFSKTQSFSSVSPGLIFETRSAKAIRPSGYFFFSSARLFPNNIQNISKSTRLYGHKDRTIQMRKEK